MFNSTLRHFYGCSNQPFDDAALRYALTATAPDHGLQFRPQALQMANADFDFREPGAGDRIRLLA